MALDEVGDFRKLLFRLTVACCEKALIAEKTSNARPTADSRIVREITVPNSFWGRRMALLPREGNAFFSETILVMIFVFILSSFLSVFGVLLTSSLRHFSP
jgi:hypothetical protein